MTFYGFINIFQTIPMLTISASFYDACLICNIITLTENTVRWLDLKLYVWAVNTVVIGALVMAAL